MRHSLSPPVFRIGRSKTGLGLFATSPIRKGAFIAEYWGKRIPTKTADDLNKAVEGEKKSEPAGGAEKPPQEQKQA